MAGSADDAGMEVYFFGKKLYGNDFTQYQIDAWFADEVEGYFNLTQSGDGVYHARNSIQKLRPTAVFYVLQKPPLDGSDA